MILSRQVLLSFGSIIRTTNGKSWIKHSRNPRAKRGRVSIPKLISKNNSLLEKKDIDI